MHIYWASVFILPNRIVHDLEQLMRGFLWCQGEMKSGKAKVDWDFVCMPKHEGGLCIRKIDDFNVALMATHIWKVMLVGDGASFSIFDPQSDRVFGIRLTMENLHLRDRDGVLWPFSVAYAWDTIRTRADIVDWLRQWDVGPSIDLNLLRCPLCDLVPDSHDHLFFECAFSSQVWSKVHVLCCMDSIPPWLIDVTTFITFISKGKMAVSILSRLVLAATSYYIWLERNERLFKKKTSSPDQIVDVIISMVRLKLVTFKFKKMSTRSRLLLDQWKISSYCIVHDGSSR
ncbi:hypothetical protein Tco_1143233 [Tanacetum coccineum]